MSRAISSVIDSPITPMVQYKFKLKYKYRCETLPPLLCEQGLALNGSHFPRFIDNIILIIIMGIFIMIIMAIFIIIIMASFIIGIFIVGIFII